MATFNLWHDEKIMDLVQDYSDRDPQNSLNQDGCGMFEIEVSVLKKLLKQKKITLEDYQRDAIKSDIAFAQQNGDEYVLYEAF